MRTRFVTLSLFAALTSCKEGLKPAEPDPVTDPNSGECSSTPTPGTPLRLLSRAEYNSTVRDLLGAVDGPAKDFPREPLAHGFDNDAVLNQVTGPHVTAYLEASELLAHDTINARRSTVVPCETSDQACGELFIATMGLKAFRRPLNADERMTLNTLFTTISATQGFEEALEVTLESMLQSPQFLYRDEQALGEPTTPVVKLGGYELASRLSYFLWGTMPDAALLEAAANGVLDQTSGIEAQARRMLDDAKATDGMMRFFSLWLYLDGVETTEKNTQVYPQYSPALAKAWRQSLELFITDVMSHEGTLKALLTSKVMYTNNAMSMYGPAANSPEFVRSVMEGSQRQGLLTQPGFLAFKAMPDGSSPVRRGIFVLDKLMCEVPPPPPAAANITPPEPSTVATTRERFEGHSKSDGCSGCHKFIDPVGFTFENYDGLGQWRDTENGQPIDARGGVKVSRDEQVIGEVNGAGELSAKLAQSRNVHDCVAKEFYRFALGRELTQADTCVTDRINERFMNSGGNFKELMLAIVQSPAFSSNLNPGSTP